MSVAQDITSARSHFQAILAGVFLALAACAAAAAGDPKAGEIKALACQVCHGPKGVSTNPLYPILAGQHAEYLERQLRHFRDKSRIDAVMNEMTQKLTDKDIQDLASYFANAK
ncbi:MAG: cytochrome c [Pseudomonadota bacterium]